MGDAPIAHSLANLNTYMLLGTKPGMTIKHMLDALTKSPFLIQVEHLFSKVPQTPWSHLLCFTIEQS